MFSSFCEWLLVPVFLVSLFSCETTNVDSSGIDTHEFVAKSTLSIPDSSISQFAQPGLHCGSMSMRLPAPGCLYYESPVTLGAFGRHLELRCPTGTKGEYTPMLDDSSKHVDD